MKKAMLYLLLWASCLIAFPACDDDWFDDDDDDSGINFNGNNYDCDDLELEDTFDDLDLGALPNFISDYINVNYDDDDFQFAIHDDDDDDGDDDDEGDDDDDDNGDDDWEIFLVQDNGNVLELDFDDDSFDDIEQLGNIVNDIPDNLLDCIENTYPDSDILFAYVDDDDDDDLEIILKYQGNIIKVSFDD
jgi:hypothetical protein